MEVNYFENKDAFLEAIMSHRYRAEQDETDALQFIDKSQIGDWAFYSKGIFIKVKNKSLRDP